MSLVPLDNFSWSLFLAVSNRSGCSQGGKGWKGIIDLEGKILKSICIAFTVSFSQPEGSICDHTKFLSFCWLFID